MKAAKKLLPELAKNNNSYLQKKKLISSYETIIFDL